MVIVEVHVIVDMTHHFIHKSHSSVPVLVDMIHQVTAMLFSYQPTRGETLTGVKNIVLR